MCVSGASLHWAITGWVVEQLFVPDEKEQEGRCRAKREKRNEEVGSGDWKHEKRFKKMSGKFESHSLWLEKTKKHYHVINCMVLTSAHLSLAFYHAHVSRNLFPSAPELPADLLGLKRHWPSVFHAAHADRIHHSDGIYLCKGGRLILMLPELISDFNPVWGTRACLLSHYIRYNFSPKYAPCDWGRHPFVIEVWLWLCIQLEFKVGLIFNQSCMYTLRAIKLIWR